MNTRNSQRVIRIQLIVLLEKVNLTIHYLVAGVKDRISAITNRITAQKDYYSISKTFDTYQYDHEKSAKRTTSQAEKEKASN